MVPMMVSRTLSIPVCEAASISCTSIERLSDISLHEGQASGSSGRQGVAVGLVAFGELGGLRRKHAVGGLASASPLGKKKRGCRLSCSLALGEKRATWRLAGV